MTRSSNIDVRLRLQGARTFAAQLAGASAELKAMGVAGTGALTSFAQKSQGLKSFGSTMSRNVTLPLLAVGGLAAKTAIDFDRSMAQVGVALDVPSQAMGGLHDLAIQMGAETVFSANDAAGAMLELAKGGMTQAEIQGGALKSTMVLAAAGGLELADSAVKVSSAMNTFGLGAKDSASIADALAGAANASSADVSDMGMALAQVGQGATNAGLNINETTGALAAFADNGVKGSDAGTSLKTMLQRLNPQSAKAKGLMNQLGLSFYDAQGNTKSLTGITHELTKAFGGMTEENRNAALQTIFGSDATRAASILFKEGAGGVREYIKATKERGAAQKMADAQMKGLPGAWESLKGSLETAALVMGEKLAPVLEAVAGFVMKVVNAFTTLPGPMQTAIVAFLAASAAIGPLSYGLGLLAGGVGRLVLWLPKLIAFTRGFMALRAGVGIMEALRVALVGFGITLRGVMITTGIGAVITAVILLNEKFHFIKPVLEAIGKAAQAAFGWIKTAATAAADWVVTAWRNARDWVTGAWDDVVGFFRALPGKIKDALLGLADMLISPFRDAFNWIKGGIDDLLNKMHVMTNKSAEAAGAIADAIPGLQSGVAGSAGGSGGGGLGAGGGGPASTPHPNAPRRGVQLGNLTVPMPDRIDFPATRLTPAGAGGPTIVNRFYVDSKEVATKVADTIERAQARR